MKDFLDELDMEVRSIIPEKTVSNPEQKPASIPQVVKTVPPVSHAPQGHNKEINHPVQKQTQTQAPKPTQAAVSYTHLTLPTICSV